MSKRIKMVLYGEPGVGKSVFALKAPKPFFITTDGNFEWLEEFGAKEEDHIQVFSWEEMKKAFNEDYDGYETIVVDLLEDGFKWCESEYCKRNKLEHVSEKGYSIGYDTTRSEFFIGLSKLLGKDKNIILLSHGNDKTVKDRRGVEHTNYIPSKRIPDALWENIEGRVRYFLRCYMKGEATENGTIIKKRYLSLIPKENEYGITRGIDESKVPQDIELDFNEFAKAIGFDTTVLPNIKAKRAVKKAEEFKEAEKKIDKAIDKAKDEEVEGEVVEENNDEQIKNTTLEEAPLLKKPEKKIETPKEEPKSEEPKAEESKPEVTNKSDAEAKKAAILAKLQQMKKN